MNNQKLMQEMMTKKVWALIGATPNTAKTANHIYHTFLQNGYKVYPVNPNYSEMENGDICYASLTDLPEKPDCIDFVVPPAVTMKNLAELDPAEYPNIWLQPGTFDDEVLAFAKSKGFQTVADGACTMAYLRLNGSGC